MTEGSEQIRQNESFETAGLSAIWHPNQRES